MRQIASLANARHASRFAAYLVTQGISAQADEDNGNWSVWVRDEDNVPAARAALAEFQANPEDARFQGVEQTAEQRRRDEAAKREAARKNVVTMGERWRGPGVRHRRPLTLAFMFLCTAISVMTNMGADRENPIMQSLQFHRSDVPEAEWTSGEPLARLVDIRKGEIWRIVTPALLHFGAFHLVFNLVMFYQLASMIEHRIGSVSLLVLMLAIAIPSNLAQALMPSDWGGSGFFGGLSGVVFGLLGYAWMKTRFEPASGIYISRHTLFTALFFLGLGLAGAFNTGGIRMANWAHSIGFLTGLAIGYAGFVLRRG